MYTLTIRDLKAAGGILFVGAIQFTLVTLISEALYPGYSEASNYISDLGVWGNASALLFNPSIVIAGIATVISAYLIKRALHGRLFPVFLALSGVGSLIVGFFPEDTVLVGGLPLVHTVGAFMAFIFGAASAISAYRITKFPFNYISVLLGLTSLVAFVLLITTGGSGFLGLGGGTLERLVAYPNLFWTIGFSGYIMGAGEIIGVNLSKNNLA